MELSRREALVGAAMAAAVPLLKPVAANAEGPATLHQAASFYRYKVGDILVTVVSDGAATFPIPDNFVTNASKVQINTALEKAFRPKDKVTIAFGPLVLNTGGKVVVIDTGSGAAAYAKTKGAIGQFGVNSAAAGFDPKKVDTVVISHFHSDHGDGLLTADDKPVFPTAEILVPAVEWKFFMDDGEMSRAPVGRMQTVFKDNRRVFDALSRKVTPYEWGKDVAPGLLAVETIGHTPGHTSFVLSSGNDKVFIQSDVTNNPDLFAHNPGWHASYDQLPDVAETTRRKVYDMLVAERLKVQGYHYPFPGVGNIEKDGAGYRVVPAAWNPSI
jgi:glyoxylase-like metal-dependent hydrolase (beta-lactamase superfamily II)